MSEATMEKKKLELRRLKGEDVFPMSTIINKLGFKEFKSCFETEDVKKAIRESANGGTINLEGVGVQIIFDVAGVVLGNLNHAKKEIITLLSSLAGVTKEEIESLELAEFAELIIDVIKKDEFKDFFSVVSKLLK